MINSQPVILIQERLAQKMVDREEKEHAAAAAAISKMSPGRGPPVSLTPGFGERKAEVATGVKAMSSMLDDVKDL